MSWLRHIERLLLIFGVLMLALYCAAQLHRIVLVYAELPSQQPDSADEDHKPALATNPDFSLWAQRRVREYQKSLASHFSPAIAILRIPKIHVEVPVLEGTDDLTLNRGVGHVVGTASPGENSNIAIAGHRDGFFRGLKDLALGDRIEMDTRGRADTYVVDRITIVDPTDVSVLEPRSHASLTLVTCYPFYFVGSAPKRYIVQASAVDSAQADTQVNGQRRSK
jgi:sortase A